MQATFARALLVLLACTSATHAMPNLVIEARADNAVNQANAPSEAQLAQAKEQANQFLSAHQEETAALADSLNEAQEAAKANGKNLDIGGILNGLDLSGINLKDLNISASPPADKKDDDSKPPAWPYPIGGFYGGYGGIGWGGGGYNS